MVQTSKFTCVRLTCDVNVQKLLFLVICITGVGLALEKFNI